MRLKNEKEKQINFTDLLVNPSVPSNPTTVVSPPFTNSDRRLSAVRE
jgi:hypothetical protein